MGQKQTQTDAADKKKGITFGGVQRPLGRPTLALVNIPEEPSPVEVRKLDKTPDGCSPPPLQPTPAHILCGGALRVAPRTAAAQRRE